MLAKRVERKVFEYAVGCQRPHAYNEQLFLLLFVQPLVFNYVLQRNKLCSSQIAAIEFSLSIKYRKQLVNLVGEPNQLDEIVH